MVSPWKSALLCGCAALAFSATAIAQTASPPPAGAAPLYDPQQLPAYRGQVQQFTLTPRGDIDGLILVDGTEVKTPRHLSTALAYLVKAGDTVTVHGLRAAALPLVQAVSITDEANGRTVVDNGPPGPGRGRGAPPPPPALGSGAVPSSPAAPISGLTEAQGRVRMTLHGRQGEVNGALLDDGTVLRLPPPEAYRFAALLQPGQTVVAEGVGSANAIGKVLEVWQLGASRDQLSQVQVPPGRGGKRGRGGPPPAFVGFAPPPPPRP